MVKRKVYAMKTTSGTFAANGVNHHNCNRLLNGNYEVYDVKIRQELGDERCDELWQLARSSKKINTSELESLLENRRKILYKIRRVD